MNLTRAINALKIIQPRSLSASREKCQVCEFPFIVKIANSEIGVRCPRCGASAITQSIVSVIKDRLPSLRTSSVYELSAYGPLVEFLRKNAMSLTTSEFFENIPSGKYFKGTLCQDVQALSFENESFDLCTSTEVFEHVENDETGFKEIHRILRKGGVFIFTVPLSEEKKTIERTAILNGVRIRTHDAEYHSDTRRGEKIFVYRNYGLDIIDRLQECDFKNANIIVPKFHFFGYYRKIIIAEK